MYLTRQILIFAVIAFQSVGWAQIRSKLALFNESFLSSAYDSAASRQFQYLGLQLKNKESDEGYFQIDMEGAVAFGAPLLSYSKVNEIYFKIETAENQRVSLGRHKVNWSGLDDRWAFGVWQPVFKVNPLSPESQGLIGLFWELDNSWSSLSFFASPLYIPNQGPSFDIDENGQFVKGNPWFQRPPETIRIYQEDSKVEYIIDKSNESSLFYQSSYSARAKIHDEKGSLAQISYAYKPMNSLALPYDWTKDIAKNRISVTIQPHVYYHSVLGTDLAWSQKWFQVGASMLLDKPQKPANMEAQWNYPIMDPAQIYSGFIDFNFKYIQISFERIQVFEGDIHEAGDLAGAEQAHLTFRFPFYEANRISLKSVYFLKKNRKLNSALIWTQSQKDQFQMLQFKSYFQFSSLWSMYGDIQLVQAQESDTNRNNEISQYANNDRFSLGVTYVF